MNNLEIIRNKIPRQSQRFGDHKLSTLLQRLSQVNVAGISLSREFN